MDKIIYYKDELNDEFSNSNIKPRTIDENYKYIHKNPFWHIGCFFTNLITFPIMILYPKIKFNLKYIGKEKLKGINTGYFIYANHTQVFGDTHFTKKAVFPRFNDIIVNSENVSMPFFGNSIQTLGAIPVPTNRSAYKNFFECIKKKINNKDAITIYPEAHIWPYYTKIRNFKAVSFKYPIELNVPSFCITNTYQKVKNNKVQIISYIDGPFYGENKQDLRDKIYNKMVERSENSNIEVIKYILDKEKAKDV